MNILIIHEVDWLKKVTYEIHHLSEFFSLYGHNVFAIDIPDPGKISFKKSKTIKNYHRIYENASVTLLHTPIIPIKGLDRITAYFSSYSFIKKIILENNIDVVFLFGVVTNGKATIKVCKEFNVPVIHRTLDVIHELIREKFLEKFVYNIEKTIYPQFDLVLCQTPFMKNWAKEIGAKNVEVIPQGVDSKIMKPIPPDIELRKKLGLNENDKVIMYLGTVYSFSGLDEIIKKIPKMIAQIPDLKFLIVGGGPDLDSFKELSKKFHVANRMTFTGFVPYLDIPKYASLAKIFINPFRKIDVTDKLSPVKIFDLLSCGKPVIATPLDGLMHDFPKEKDIIVYSDLENFDEKIISLMKSNSLKIIGEKGRNFVEKNYTWPQVAERTLKMFEKVIAQKKHTD